MTTTVIRHSSNTSFMKDYREQDFVAGSREFTNTYNPPAPLASKETLSQAMEFQAPKRQISITETISTASVSVDLETASPPPKLRQNKHQTERRSSTANRLEDAKAMLERGLILLEEARSEPGVQLPDSALQDLHRALQVQELCLGKSHDDCQETRMLLVESHAIRSHWGKAGLWMLRMLRVTSTGQPEPVMLLGYVNCFDSSSPAAQALQVARSALREERLGDVAANQKMQYDRAGSLYEQALQRIEQIQAMDGEEAQEYGQDEVFYINGVAMTVNGAVVTNNDNSEDKPASILPVDSADLSSKLGQVYRIRRNFHQAKRAYSDACDAYLRVLGPAHPSTITAQQQLAVVSESAAEERRQQSLKQLQRSSSRSLGGGSIKSFKSAFSFRKKGKQDRKSKKNKNKEEEEDIDFERDSLFDDASTKYRKENGKSGGVGGKIWKKMFGGSKKKGKGGEEIPVDIVDPTQMEISMPALLLD